MTAAIISLAIALAGTGSGVILLAMWLRSALRGESKARDELREAMQAGDRLIAAATEANAKIATLDSQLADATFRMLAAEGMRDDLARENARHVQTEILAAPTADAALDAFNAQLRRREEAHAKPAPDGDRRPGDPVRAPTAPSAP